MAKQKIVTGDKELDKALEKLPLAMQKKPIRKGTRKVAHVVAAAAKMRAPVDTGDLEESIKVRAAKFARRSGKFGHRVQVGEEGEIPTWVFVEFGTIERQTAAGAGRGAMQEDPFLRPALYDVGGAIAQPTVAAEVRAFIAGLKP